MDVQGPLEPMAFSLPERSTPPPYRGLGPVEASVELDRPVSTELVCPICKGHPDQSKKGTFTDQVVGLPPRPMVPYYLQPHHWRLPPWFRGVLNHLESR